MKRSKIDSTTEQPSGGENAPHMDMNVSPEPSPHDVTASADSASDAPQDAPAESIETLKAEVASSQDTLLRAKAEFQNFRRRSAKEQNEAVRFANAGLMRSLLPILDDFERIVEAAEENDDPAAAVEGTRMVRANLDKALRDHGLSAIAAIELPFDPAVHEAILQQPSADHPGGTVLKEITRGYRLGDRVLRPTQVIVSQAVDGQPESSMESEDPAPADGDAADEPKKNPTP